MVLLLEFDLLSLSARWCWVDAGDAGVRFHSSYSAGVANRRDGRGSGGGPVVLVLGEGGKASLLMSIPRLRAVFKLLRSAEKTNLKPRLIKELSRATGKDGGN